LILSASLIKDYSALLEISEMDNLLFNVADMDYVGSIMSCKADGVKDLKFKEEKKKETLEMANISSFARYLKFSLELGYMLPLGR